MCLSTAARDGARCSQARQRGSPVRSAQRPTHGVMPPSLDNQLTGLPPEIGQLAHLNALMIFDNQLSTLPPEIGQLTDLVGLSVSHNRLTELPPEIGQLTDLEGLSLNNNQLSELPPEIRQLTQLTHLDLRGNPLLIPPEILEKTNEPSMILDYYFDNVTG